MDFHLIPDVETRVKALRAAKAHVRPEVLFDLLQDEAPVAALAREMLIEDLVALESQWSRLDELDDDDCARLLCAVLSRQPTFSLRVIERCGAVPEDVQLASALAASLRHSEDPRAADVLLELCLAGFCEIAAVPLSRLQLLLTRTPEQKRAQALRAIMLKMSPTLSHHTALEPILNQSIKSELDLGVTWPVLFGYFALEPLGARVPDDGPSCARHYALEERPRFYAPPESWEDEHKRMSLRFALNVPALRGQVKGFVRATPEPWVTRVLLEHLAISRSPMPNDAEWIRERPAAEVAAAIDQIGRTFRDAWRFGADPMKAFGKLRVKARQRIKGWLLR